MKFDNIEEKKYFCKELAEKPNSNIDKVADKNDIQHVVHVSEETLLRIISE